MKTYTHSGKWEPAQLVIWTLVGMAACAVISVAYTIIAHINPFIYLNAVLLILAVMLLGRCAVFAIKRAHSRNRVANTVATAIMCLFGWYTGWCALLAMFFDVGFLSIFTDVGGFFGSVLLYSETIVMTIRNSTIPTVGLQAFYLVEFVAFLAPMIMVNREKLYYCEDCRKFLDNKDYYIPDMQTVEANMEAIKKGDLSVISQIEEVHTPKPAPAMEQYKFNLHYCKGCKNKVYNLYRLTMKEKKGKFEQASSQTIVSNLYADGKYELFGKQPAQ